MKQCDEYADYFFAEFFLSTKRYKRAQILTHRHQTKHKELKIE